MLEWQKKGRWWRRRLIDFLIEPAHWAITRVLSSSLSLPPASLGHCSRVCREYELTIHPLTGTGPSEINSRVTNGDKSLGAVNKRASINHK